MPGYAPSFSQHSAGYDCSSHWHCCGPGQILAAFWAISLPVKHHELGPGTAGHIAPFLTRRAARNGARADGCR